MAAGGVGLLAVFSGQVKLSLYALQDFIRHPLGDGDFQNLLVVVIFTWFMAVFPDVDIDSKPRKYFYRAVFVGFVFLFILQAHRLLAILGLIAIMPLLHKHRGWTHWRITPWVFAIIFAIIWEYFRAKNAWFSGFSWKNVIKFLFEHWIFTASFVVGHYTHLLLDSKIIHKAFR